MLVTSKNTSKWGELSIIDSSFEMAGAPNASAAAVVTDRSLYLNNVYIKGYGLATSSATVSGAAPGGLNASKWTRVDELAVGRPIPQPPKGCAEMTMSVFVNGARKPDPILETVTPGVPPPAALASQHSWDEPTFPTMDMRAWTAGAPAGVVDVVRDFGAVGDGLHDDTAAIQKALNVAGATVLLPKGFYRISRTLTMAAGGATTLLGMTRTFSVLMAASDGLAADPAVPGGAAPMLRVANLDARVVLTMFTVVIWEHLNNTWALDWQNHNPGSVYRQNYFYRITECLYDFAANGTVRTAVPSRTPTMPCRGRAVLAHPLNVISGSIAAYVCRLHLLIHPHAMLAHPAHPEGGTPGPTVVSHGGRRLLLAHTHRGHPCPRYLSIPHCLLITGTTSRTRTFCTRRPRTGTWWCETTDRPTRCGSTRPTSSTRAPRPTWRS